MNSTIKYQAFLTKYNSLINSVFTDYDNVLRNYKVEFEDIIIDNFSYIENTFKNLAKTYKIYLNERTELNIVHAWDFSIFKIIKVKREEENLHSRLLKELIDPVGTHGQKDLFYKLFIKRFLSEGVIENFINDNYKDYFIKREEHIDTGVETGRIDIFLKSSNPKKKFAIIIENKWDSGDSCSDQLYKYYISKKMQGFDDTNLLVFYLSKNGNDPLLIEEGKFKTFLDDNINKNYFPISYIDHIYKWLSDCHDNCKSPKIKYLIEQYKSYIYESN